MKNWWVLVHREKDIELFSVTGETVELEEESQVVKVYADDRTVAVVFNADSVSLTAEMPLTHNRLKKCRVSEE